MNLEQLNKEIEHLKKQIDKYDSEAVQRELIKEKSIKYRGQIIDAVADLDRQLDFYIATYFCSDIDKVKEFSNIILGANRISLDGKRKLFDVLIKIQRPDFFKFYKSFNKDMNTIMYERNSFAHNSICMSSEAVERSDVEIGLQKFSANSRIDWYTDSRVKSTLKIITKCSNIIVRMTRTRLDVLRPPDYEPKFENPAS